MDSTADRARGAAADPHPSALAAKISAVRAVQADQDAAAGRFGSPPRDYAVPVSGARVRPQWRSRYTRWLLLADLVAAVVAVLARHQLAVWGHPGPGPATGSVGELLVLAPVLVLVLVVARAYQHRVIGHGVTEYRRVLSSGVLSMAAVSTAALATGSAVLRDAAVLTVPTAFVLVLVGRFGARRVLHELRRNGLACQRVVAVGLERSVAELVRATRAAPEAGLLVVAACIGRSRDGAVEGVPVLGTPGEVRTVVAAAGADTVLITAWSDVSEEDLRRLSWDLEGSGIQLLVSPRIAEVAVPRLQVRTAGRVTVVDIEEPEFTGLRRVAKLGLDYALCLLAVVGLSPLLLAVAVAVRCTSPGPVLFRQERIGRYGRPFTMHKFRSMFADAQHRQEELAHLNDRADGLLFKMEHDPRVTPLGRVLRRYSLDELPQLFDVLTGAMSLVGPRPPLPGEVARYPHDVRRRLLVRPGITGLWQVSGRSNLSWEQSVRLDLGYVENWTLGTDIVIIARTVGAVLRSEGAY